MPDGQSSRSSAQPSSSAPPAAILGSAPQIAEIREIAGTLGNSPAAGRPGTLTLNTMVSPGPGPFGDIELLRNHWSDPARPRAYYWYLTFAGDAAVCDLAARSQRALAFPYYDLVPPHGLHMTLGRIAPEGGITAAQLNSVSEAARLACRRPRFASASRTSAEPAVPLGSPLRLSR